MQGVVGGERIHNMGQEKASCGLVVEKRSYWASARPSPIEGGLSCRPVVLLARTARSPLYDS